MISISPKSQIFHAMKSVFFHLNSLFSDKSTTTSLKGQDDYSITDGNINYANFNDDYYDAGGYPIQNEVISTLIAPTTTQSNKIK